VLGSCLGAGGKKRSAEAEFNQNYQAGSKATNFDCKATGSCFGAGKKKRSADADFKQNYQPGSKATNFNCQQAGSCLGAAGKRKRSPEPQFHQTNTGSTVTNFDCKTSGSCNGAGGGDIYNQDYFGGSSSTNISGKKKRSAEPDFKQNFQGGSQSTNFNCQQFGSCAGAGVGKREADEEQNSFKRLGKKYKKNFFYIYKFFEFKFC